MMNITEFIKGHEGEILYCFNTSLVAKNYCVTETDTDLIISSNDGKLIKIPKGAEVKEYKEMTKAKATYIDVIISDTCYSLRASKYFVY